MTLTVENFYERLKEKHDPNENNPHFKEHGIKIPFRMLIVGASGSMKTNSALDICKKFSDTFSHITIVTRNVKEPLYLHMQENIDASQLTVIEIEEDDLSELPEMKTLTNKEPHTLIIFDDLVLVKDQRKITEFFIRCRKYNISAMYLTQSYFGTPKKIRGNCNIILFKKVNSKRDLQTILSEYSLSIELPELLRIHQDATKNQLDWLMVRMDNPPGKQFFHNYSPLLTSGHESSGDAIGQHENGPETPTQEKVPCSKKTRNQCKLEGKDEHQKNDQSKSVQTKIDIPQELIDLHSLAQKRPIETTINKIVNKKIRTLYK